MESLIKEAQLGIEAEEFLATDLGRYLIARANEEREEAIELLITEDPNNIRAITKLQNKIAVVDSIQTWIANAIQNGYYAESEIRESES
jgi:predicted ATP-dependent serine protease